MSRSIFITLWHLWEAQTIWCKMIIETKTTPRILASYMSYSPCTGRRHAMCERIVLKICVFKECCLHTGISKSFTELGYITHTGNGKHLWNDELQDLKILYHLPVICWEITKIHQSCSLERHSAKQTQKVTFPLPVHLASSLSRDLICLLEPQFSWDRNRKMYISITGSSGASGPSGAP